MEEEEGEASGVEEKVISSCSKCEKCYSCSGPGKVH
jgi:hypothetical protein